MANYTYERSKYGGCVGSIIIHTTPGISTSNDPTTAAFKDDIPAGYLKCDGSVLSARDFLALSRVIGVGDECRFKREASNVRNADALTGDLGQFQLPDLGSKVIVGGRGSGTYNNDFVDREGVVTTVTNRVGPQIEVICNESDRLTTTFLGNARVTASGTLNMLGSPRYTLDRNTSNTELTIENFQGHLHNSNQAFLNYSTRHLVGGEGGKDSGQSIGNSGAGNQIDFTGDGGRESIHDHRITRPTTYTHNFTYSYAQQDIDMTGVTATVDVDISDEEKIDQLVTPFILVQYIIKF
jgi:hypothetical protein